MKVLYILRHAKSSWDNPRMTDFDRPLNDRGLRTVPLMGEIFVKNNFQPELIVSSPAVRARETANMLKTAADLKAEIEFDEHIYEASTQTLLKLISALGEPAESAMIVGHNPGLEGLIKALSGEYQIMPTAGLAIIDLNVENWENTGEECGRLREIFRPREEFNRL